MRTRTPGVASSRPFVQFGNAPYSGRTIGPVYRPFRLPAALRDRTSGNSIPRFNEKRCITAPFLGLFGRMPNSLQRSVLQSMHKLVA